MDFSLLIEIFNSWFILILFTHLIITSKTICKTNKYLSFVIISITVILTYYALFQADLGTFWEFYLLSIVYLILYNLFFKGSIFNKSLTCIILLQFFVLSRVWMFIIHYIIESFSHDFIVCHYLHSAIDYFPFLSRNLIFICLSISLFLKIRSSRFDIESIYKNTKLIKIGSAHV